ncbi:hypothetical protein SDRG_10381 [Saprolegnia diclina VS20]|uniref:Uncharacterized protein n=1 Tax=Saprolegnia diclina (strain VS20) TaxID=1156394 RepID=T0RIK7_SAPDV|nr:hypothetical protein SDRG_10381 [Saprolegnia diclina VS20]EQC32188.1 hypothetical protein SDRG_10381 [Saprolegnia diclina VS20]|eukprot:XP_008614590.1 hypothetical protein SDRG_10381 [Saprolegnia diclina VS20]
MKSESCDFKGCHRPIDAASGAKRTCAVHKYRRHCAIPLCTNQVYARKLCARHGGKRTCKVDRCCAPTTGRGGFCSVHGPARNRSSARSSSAVSADSTSDESDDARWSPLAFRTDSDPLLVEVSADILSLILELDSTPAR